MELRGDLENALRYVLCEKYGADTNSKLPDSFYISPDGRFVLGRTYGEKYVGWINFQFDPSIEFLALVIRQHFLKQKFPNGYDGDGNNENGYIINTKYPEYHTENQMDEVYDIRWVVITIETFTCDYSK